MGLLMLRLRSIVRRSKQMCDGRECVGVDGRLCALGSGQMALTMYVSLRCAWHSGCEACQMASKQLKFCKVSFLIVLTPSSNCRCQSSQSFCTLFRFLRLGRLRRFRDNAKEISLPADPPYTPQRSRCQAVNHAMSSTSSVSLNAAHECHLSFLAATCIHYIEPSRRIGKVMLYVGCVPDD